MNSTPDNAICGYKHLGKCSSVELTHKIVKYFRDGRSLFFCYGHAKKVNHV